MRIINFVDQLWRDFGLAARRLRKTPVFTVFAVVSLALSVGVTTAVYSTIDSVLWNSPSVREPDAVAVVTLQPTAEPPRWLNVMSWSDFGALRSRTRSVTALAASSLVDATLNDGNNTSRFAAHAVTGNCFSVLGLSLHLGRGIQEGDDRPEADPVVVLSYRFWQSKIRGDRQVLGRTVRIAGHPFVVIGVGAERIHSARDLLGQHGFVEGDGWISLAARSLAYPAAVSQRDQANLTVMARLPQKSVLQSFAAEVASIGAALDETTPIAAQAGAEGRAARTWSATTLAAIGQEQSASTGTTGAAIVLLVGLTLVVACTNIANLVHGRSASRVHEFTVRRTVGASRVRLVCQQCTESVLLAAVGGVVALAVTRLLLNYFTIDIPITNLQTVPLQPGLRASALGIAAGSLLLAVVIFGIVPALQLTRASLHTQLSSSAPGALRSGWRGRRYLIALQVTISTAFLLITFAAARAVATETGHDPGFALRELAVGYVEFDEFSGDSARRRQLVGAIETAARAQPGFEEVALTTALPLGSGTRVRNLARFSIVDKPSVSHTPLVLCATTGIFRTLGIPIVQGRPFDARDTSGAKLVMVVSERLAKEAFGGSNVIGHQMVYHRSSDKPTMVEVIGVARDTDTLDLLDRRFGVAYLPLAQHDTRRVIIVGRTSGNPEPMVGSLSGILRRADPDLALESAATGPMAMTPSSVILRMAAVLAGGLALVSVALAMLGLYGVLSNLATIRTREIGVRLALGAEPGRVCHMLVIEGLRPVVWGVGFGLILAVGVRIVIRATEVGRNVAMIDALAFVAVSLTLVAVALAACYLPARRVSRVDPNIALRDL